MPLPSVIFLYIVLQLTHVFLKISLTHVRVRRGPSALPCGTLDVTLTSSDNCPPNLTLCERRKRNSCTHTKTLESTPEAASFVRSILEYEAVCWDRYREGQISALDRVQKKAAKFARHTSSPNWETLASRRKLSCICALFKAYCGERAWKAVGDRLQRPHYLSRVDHERKIRSRRQRTDIGKYSFVNRTTQHCNQLPAEV